VPLVPKRTTGAPHLARFLRDVGFHSSFPLTLDSSDALSGEHRWYPISREKRARYGAPVLREGMRSLRFWFRCAYGSCAGARPSTKLVRCAAALAAP
jgi:hypothetical protein